MARPSGLGKGLGALIPSTPTTQPEREGLLELAITDLEPNRYQPRAHFDEEGLTSLTASIRELGVLQPVLARKKNTGGYELIAGERRWRAAKRAGLQTIPVLIRSANDTNALEQALVENLHREDLNALEEAAAYQQLADDFSMTHEDIARRVGKSRAAISNALRLFQLPPAVQRLVQQGSLSAGHARALLGSPDRSFQEALARKAVSDGYSVRQVEDAVRKRSRDGEDRPAPGTVRAPGLLELEELLSERLNTRVQVAMGAKRGKITIDFATVEDLERIYRSMSGIPQPASEIVELTPEG